MISQIHEINRKWKIVYKTKKDWYLKWEIKNEIIISPNIDQVKRYIKKLDAQYVSIVEITTEEELNKEIIRIKPFLDFNKEIESFEKYKSHLWKIRLYKALIISIIFINILFLYLIIK